MRGGQTQVTRGFFRPEPGLRQPVSASLSFTSGPTVSASRPRSYLKLRGVYGLERNNELGRVVGPSHRARMALAHHCLRILGSPRGAKIHGLAQRER